MTDPNFKKRLDEATWTAWKWVEKASAYPNSLTQYDLGEMMFKSGSSWMVDEIVAWLRSDEAQHLLKENADQKHRDEWGPTLMTARLWANEIDRRFRCNP